MRPGKSRGMPTGPVHMFAAPILLRVVTNSRFTSRRSVLMRRRVVSDHIGSPCIIYDRENRHQSEGQTAKKPFFHSIPLAWIGLPITASKQRDVNSHKKVTRLVERSLSARLVECRLSWSPP